VITIDGAERLKTSDGLFDSSYAGQEGWAPYKYGTRLILMFGDDMAGPFVLLSSMPATETMMDTGFSHSHASDNFRITVRGITNMGRDAYSDGQFRFQDGGVPYPPDNVAWGPDGGYGLVMFGDRRGFAINPVKKELAEEMRPRHRRIADQLGIDMRDECPGAPAIATTAGGTERGHLVGGFDDSDRWPEIDAGTRALTALLGDRVCGPLLLLAAAEPGAMVVPGGSWDTDLLHIVVEGSAGIGHDELPAGSVRVQEAGTAMPPIVAGADGLHYVAVIGDRRALGAFGAALDSAAQRWVSSLAEMNDRLNASLAC
jgi:hypothetical protein